MLFLEKIEKIISNKKIKLGSDVEIETSLKTIAEIPLKENGNTKLISSENQEFLITKAFKNLRTNIQFLCVNNQADKKVMLVTSARADEGKSFVTANLAVSFAEIGKKVLIIDGDMTNGKQDKIFNIPNNLGLSNYLSNLDFNGVEINEFLSKFINETAVKNVNLITSGTIPPNPAELLASPKLQELIKDAKVFFDIIIIDAGEILEKTEALILTRSVNSTILVASSKETKIEDLENAKKDIQNIGGKIIGVVLNKVKLKKVRKTRAERKDEFNKFKLRIKEKINITIETIKRKIQDSNRKLLEEAKTEEIENVKTDVVEEVLVQENKIEENFEIKEENNDKAENNLNQKENNIKILDKIKKYIPYEKKKENKEKVENKIDENIDGNQLSIFQEIPQELTDNEETNKTVIEKNNEIKEKVLEKLKTAKNVFVEKTGKIKENMQKNYNKIKETIIDKYSEIRNKETETIKTENDIEENQEINTIAEEDVVLIQEDNEQLEIEKKPEDKLVESDKMVLIVVDAEKGYCRVFSKEYFTEKLIRGIDKSDNVFRAHYSSKELNLKKEFFIDKYQLTIAQAQRIDPLIYNTLSDYDRYLWEARAIFSNKAENYALSIAKDFEMQSDELEKEHQLRSQRLRKAELNNADLEVLYKLDNLWRTHKINVFDKINLNRFAKIYEIENTMKNDAEITRFENSKRFYTDIIEGAEKRLENANEVERQKEETERLAIEEDRKIKQEELKLEQQQFEIEKREAQERIKIEQENVKAEKRAEQERLKEEKRKEKETEKAEKKEEYLRRKMEKQKKKEEAKIQKELEKAKQREEAKIEEELLEDNLYPKTKHNKYL